MTNDILPPDEMMLKRSKRSTIVMYIALIILAAASLAVSIIFDVRGPVSIISVSVILIMVVVLFTDKKFVHVPPRLIIIVMIALISSIISSIDPDNEILRVIAYVLTGMIFSIIGLILFYMSLGKKPGFLKEKRYLISIQSFMFGIAFNFIWVIIAFFAFSRNYDDEEIIYDGLYAMVGSLMVAIVFIFDGNIFLKGVVSEFMDKNYADDISDDIAQETKDMILAGESENLEFKSTIRTNLETGETDKRMERAVLKSIAAFLNTDGGTLLVGVKDDGSIMGVDIECFSNRDKMNLHIANLLSSSIGDEFIPFIKMHEIDFGKKENGNDKIVLRFDCEPTMSPVFLKDPKDKSVEIFFVRSGPSTIDLTGSELLKYVENRKKVGKKKKYHAAYKLT